MECGCGGDGVAGLHGSAGAGTDGWEKGHGGRDQLLGCYESEAVVSAGSSRRIGWNISGPARH